MMTMIKAWLMAVCVLGLAMPATAAQGNERERHWALGWEEGIVLRRALGDWDVSVSAGPSDRLYDRDVYAWDQAWPDSLQGRQIGGDEDRRESGFVRLGGGRQVSSWRDFAVHATLDGRYAWVNSTEISRYFYGEPGPDIRTVTRHEDTWDLMLGLRIAWRPVPFLDIQTRFGLRLRSATGVRTYDNYDASQDESSHEEAPFKAIDFNDFGNWGTGSFEFFFRF